MSLVCEAEAKGVGASQADSPATGERIAPWFRPRESTKFGTSGPRCAGAVAIVYRRSWSKRKAAARCSAIK